MLTNEQLQDIKNRCDKATPGPWDIDNFRTCCENGGIELCEEDEHFVTHAREDIVSLLNMVTVLQGEIYRADFVKYTSELAARRLAELFADITGNHKSCEGCPLALKGCEGEGPCSEEILEWAYQSEIPKPIK